jgi:hypothetical protein
MVEGIKRARHEKPTRSDATQTASEWTRLPSEPSLVKTVSGLGSSSDMKIWSKVDPAERFNNSAASVFSATGSRQITCELDLPLMH